MIPPSLTIAAAAAPRATQMFTVAGSAVLIPAILIYSTFAFWAFRGKVRG
jgi:cytochrome d ubiquinol oxidase subunit II